MIVLTGKGHNHNHQRIQFFCGGLSLSVARLLTPVASIVYNIISAATNTDLILNAVIIRFIDDLDELICNILIEINTCWAREEEVEETE